MCHYNKFIAVNEATNYSFHPVYTYKKIAIF